MKKRVPSRRLLRFSILVYLFAFLQSVQSYSQSSQPKRELLGDGVEHWSVPATRNGESYLTRRFEEMYKVLVPKSSQPFGKSVAFLAGVSKYESLPQLPSVHNDIVEMRDLLLNIAGFDEVYVAENDVVNRDLVEHYIKGIIAGTMSRNDRLLFYYSGHGADNQGKTGYLLFGKAQKGQFWGPQVLAIDTLTDWSRELQIQHILFIVDSCASGLAFTAKLGTDLSDKLLLQTLSGNGSRTVLTAGTANEATYAMEDRRHLGNGVFTRSLLEAFELRRESGTPFITVTDLFSGIEKKMAEFRVNLGKTTTPRMWQLQEADYRGTFVFLNTRAKVARLTAKQERALGIKPILKSENDVPAETDTGVIEIFSNEDGTLSIDSRDLGVIFSGQTRQFLKQATGKHAIQLVQFGGRRDLQPPGTSPEAKEVTVEAGKIAYASFGLQSAVDPSGKTPVGTLVLQSVHEISGEAFLDNSPVGQLEKNGQLIVINVTAGTHQWKIQGDLEVMSGLVVIIPNQTTYTVIRPPVSPTNLTAVPQ